MEEGFRLWANPSSPHAEGRKARALLEDARERIKRALGWEGELIFTSGASEALAIGLGRAKLRRKIVSAVEHDAVFRAAPDAEILPIVDGEPDLDTLGAILRGRESALVAIQSVNAETGTNLLPYLANPAAALVREYGGLLLSDCSQSAGKTPLPDCDMAILSAHKLGGPVGIGALLVRDFATLEPVGGHERGYRAGTENLPAAMGFAAAIEAGTIESWAISVEQQLDFRNALMAYAEILQPGFQCPHILAVTHPNLSAHAALIRLDAKGIAVSAGSACSSGTMKRSRSLQAFGTLPEVADRTLRVSLGWNTTRAEVERFREIWLEMARQ